MPELPEVQSTVESIRSHLVGRKIKSIKALWPKTIAPLRESQFNNKISNKRVISVTRRAKYIILNLEDSAALVIHLRMSGRLRVDKRSLPLDPYDRVVLTLKSGNELRFRDVRKFGRFSYFAKEELVKLDHKLGPEPLSSEFSSQDFYSALKRSKQRIKAFLLDQSKISGVGNIYADESLWAAKIKPIRRAESLAYKEAIKLFQAIRRILHRAILDNGTDFGDGVIYNGRFKPKAYGREGLPCFRCKSDLVKLTVAGRGTVVCNKCQK